MEEYQLRMSEKRSINSHDITSHDGFIITADQVQLQLAETVIQEEESQWAEDNNN